MDKKVYEFLIAQNFDDEDIENLCELCPPLENLSSKQMLDCVKAVTDCGYPAQEIDFLIFSNPEFLFNDPEVIRKKLQAFDKDEIEEKLKNDPKII